jgi:hypothetical protein
MGSIGMVSIVVSSYSISIGEKKKTEKEKEKEKGVQYSTAVA